MFKDSLIMFIISINLRNLNINCETKYLIFSELFIYNRSYQIFGIVIWSILMNLRIGDIFELIDDDLHEFLSSNIHQLFCIIIFFRFHINDNKCDTKRLILSFLYSTCYYNNRINIVVEILIIMKSFNNYSKLI